MRVVKACLAIPLKIWKWQVENWKSLPGLSPWCGTLGL